MSQKSSKRGNTGALLLEEAYRKAYESIAEVMENSRRRLCGHHLRGEFGFHER